jgi:hypothetical protein
MTSRKLTIQRTPAFIEFKAHPTASVAQTLRFHEVGHIISQPSTSFAQSAYPSEVRAHNPEILVPKPAISFMSMLKALYNVSWTWWMKPFNITDPVAALQATRAIMRVVIPALTAHIPLPRPTIDVRPGMGVGNGEPVFTVATEALVRDGTSPDRRCARYIGRLVRTQMTYPVVSAANRTIASDKIRQYMEAHSWRECDIIDSMPFALAVVFIPTNEEVLAREESNSVEAETQRRLIVRPIYQKLLWQPWWLPDWGFRVLPCVVRDTIFSRWIRVDSPESN